MARGEHRLSTEGRVEGVYMGSSWLIAIADLFWFVLSDLESMDVGMIDGIFHPWMTSPSNHRTGRSEAQEERQGRE